MKQWVRWHADNTMMQSVLQHGAAPGANRHAEPHPLLRRHIKNQQNVRQMLNNC